MIANDILLYACLLDHDEYTVRCILECVADDWEDASRASESPEARNEGEDEAAQSC